mmetsp:Transcript_16387/g.20021  ORF Transcript_16387/g.20021 Transcript_16387/m.20021 type:complete len:901 (+) Transcript_16387:147-2849(+)
MVPFSVESGDQYSVDATAASNDSNTDTNTMLEMIRNKKKKQSTQTHIAFYLTCATLVLLGVTMVSVHSFQYFYPSLNPSYVTSSNISTMTMTSSSSSFNYNNLRNMEEEQQENEYGYEMEEDYSAESCDNIFDYTEAASDERCLFAQTCNAYQGLKFSFIFCNALGLSTFAWCFILSPVFIILLVLLFRMLGSTSEDYFSPSLEMFSLKMGLPPRFAGVTLLALGNGAADVSATINAISQNPKEGYQMSLGALTGAGMFVGTVVAGIVIVIADGVKCRGALVRDLLMFILTLGAVYRFFIGGEIGALAIHTFLWMYFLFVLVVLIADVYHRAVVLPRLRIVQESMMIRDGDDTIATSVADENGSDNSTSENLEHSSSLRAPSSDRNDDKRVSFSPEPSAAELSTDSGDVELAHTTSTTSNQPLTLSNDTESSSPTAANSISYHQKDIFSYKPSVVQDMAVGASSSPLDESPSNNGKDKKKRKSIIRRSKKKGKRNKVQKGVDAVMMALSNYAPGEGKPDRDEDFSNGWGEGLQVTNESADKPIKLHGTQGILSKKSSEAESEEEEVENGGNRLSLLDPTASYRMLLENVDNMCTVDGSISSGLDNSWASSIYTSWVELKTHFSDYVNDIFTNEENNAFDKFFLICELPFSIFRKLSVSIPCEDYYCRGLIATSFALFPVWLGVYCIIQRDTNLFFTGGFPYIEISTSVSILISLFITKFAPAEEADLSLTVSVPIAFIGFIIAATWIDTIADQLVSLLTLLGVICRIPGSIMGLTVLAWGNSMGDLSANMTMAKKGLANMAITACFAGPVFNILIGLGLGFTKLNTTTGQDSTEVEMSPSISVGFLFLLLNCILVLLGGLVWNSGHIPKGYGYIALTLYGFYVFISIWLQFSSYNDDENE